MELTAQQRDRARGVLLGTAAGDALGAGYEFEPPRGPELVVDMVGGGVFGWEPGEWTDDTSMAIAIAEVASVHDLLESNAQDAIVRRWREWACTAKDVGHQTRAVLGALGADDGAAAAAASATAHHERTGRSGGNGSLMRTAPVALAHLDDAELLAASARQLSALTHHDSDAGDACVLWCLAIRHAVLTGGLDVRVGLDRLSPDSREVWSGRLTEAEQQAPQYFSNNGWVVHALQAAWSALASTVRIPGTPTQLLHRSLDAAVRAGNDTDTVAAIAGGLAGAAYSASAVPPAWVALLHGWPGLRAPDLLALADTIVDRSPR